MTNSLLTYRCSDGPWPWRLAYHHARHRGSRRIGCDSRTEAGGVLTASPYINPEQRAHQQIDAQLVAAGWIVQDYRQFNPVGIPTKFAGKPKLARSSARTYGGARLLALPGITGDLMEVTSVTSKGQVTIPKHVRQQLGIRQGTRLEFRLVGDHLEARVSRTPSEVPTDGFGMLKSRRKAVPADFDAATLLKPSLLRR